MTDLGYVLQGVILAALIAGGWAIFNLTRVVLDRSRFSQVILNREEQARAQRMATEYRHRHGTLERRSRGR